MNRWTQGGLFGAFIGVFAIAVAFVPFATAWQERLELDWLFTLRGPVAPPSNIVIVGMDKQSADYLGLSPQPTEWPRSLHGRLVDELVRRGVSLIVFDLAFVRPQTADEDMHFAGAIARAARVLLLENLERWRQPATGGNSGVPSEIWLDKLHRPLPVLAEAALGTAPFPLPRVPDRVSRFWTFLEGRGETPTLPALALQAMALDTDEAWLQLFENKRLSWNGTGHPPPDAAAAPPLNNLARSLRRAFKADQEMARKVRELVEGHKNDDPHATHGIRQRTFLDTLIRLYEGPGSYYLNFYGPAGTIRTIPYYAPLSDDSPDHSLINLSGATVFVGYSELAAPSKIDTFDTIFSRVDGVQMTGVEVGATAFANLLTGRPLVHTDHFATAIILLGFGAIAGALVRGLPATFAVAAALGLAAGYAAFVQLAFERQDLWLPLAIPVLVELPLALVVGLLGQYFWARLERSRMQHVTSYYVPEQVVQELADHSLHPLSVKETVHATCLAMDAENFTALSETLAPETMAAFLNDYFAALDEPLQRYGADFKEFHADSVMSAWISEQSNVNVRTRACLAALEAVEAICKFNARSAPLHLGVRIGLHAGLVFLGNMGAGGRFAFRVMGDIVNTASRIEGLNKYLGTRLLATEEVVAGVDGLLLRPLGDFRLKGKQGVASVFEIMALRDGASREQTALCGRFAGAMEAFRAQRRDEACELFDAIAQAHPDDGPSRFYVEYCRAETKAAAIDSDGPIIRLNVK
jgi:adenylate cyclase